MSDVEVAHSPYGPSQADRWSTCLGSIKANEGLPDETSEPAAEGTMAHGISNLCLRFGFDAADFVGQKFTVEGFTFTWDDENAALIQRGIDATRAWSGPLYSELRVDISQWTIPGQFGTLDRGSYDDEFIRVDDLKFGRWPVYPTRNLQLVLYALAFWNDIARHHTKTTRFLLSIDQPRCAGGGGVWETTLDELMEIGNWLRERAVATLRPDAPRTASEKACVFCKRRSAPGGCNTYETFMVNMTAGEFEELDFDIAEKNDIGLPIPSVITPERRSFILSHRKMIETWLDQLAEQELADYIAGLQTPNRKAVVDTQKGKRDAWIDEAGAMPVLTGILGDKAITKKLITPAQARKQVGDKYDLIAPFIRPGEPGKSMVPLDDARQAIPVIVADDFEDL